MPSGGARPGAGRKTDAEREATSEERADQAAENLRLTKARADKEEAANLKLRRELAILDREFILTRIVEEWAAKFGHIFGNLLSAVRQEMPALCDGLGASDIDPLVTDWADEWDMKVREVQGEVWKMADEALQKELAGSLKKIARSEARKKSNGA